MITKKVRITSPNGIHLRPAGILSAKALEYEDCTIQLRKENKSCNIKSVLTLLGSCTKQGDEVWVVCDGKDEEKALNEMVEFLEQMD